MLDLSRPRYPHSCSGAVVLLYFAGNVVAKGDVVQCMMLMVMVGWGGEEEDYQEDEGSCAPRW